MNCGKHRRPSIRRPTAARQRYEQSRLSEKPKPHATATFAQLSAVRRRKSDRKRQPRGKTSPQRRKDRQARAVPPKRILPASGTLRRPAPNLAGIFPQNKLLSGKEPTIHAAHSGKIQTIKGLRTQPTAGSVPARRKRLLRKPNLRSPPFPATDSPRSGPDRQPPHNCCRSHRSRHFPQANSSASVPTKENAIITSFLRRSDPNLPPKKGFKRESALQTRTPAANERPSNDGH